MEVAGGRPGLSRVECKAIEPRRQQRHARLGKAAGRWVENQSVEEHGLGLIGLPEIGCKDTKTDCPVVLDLDCRRGRKLVFMYAQEPAAGEQVADQRVVFQRECIFRPDVAFGTVGDEYGVLGFRALADGVADDVRDAAIGQVDFVGGFAVRAVDDVVVAKDALPCARLDQVAAIAFLEAAAGDGDFGNPTDVEQMRQRVHLARRIGEAAVSDDEFGGADVAGEDAHLIVDEGAVVDAELAAFEADARTVAGRHAGTAKFDVLDADVAVADDPDGFAFGAFAVGDEHGALADAADDELLLLPDGYIAAVFTGQDFDGVTVLGQAGGFGDAGDRLAGADAQGGGVGNGEAARQKECQKDAGRRTRCGAFHLASADCCE